eukprot:scaffold3664_cov72-Phaeocystis_antarctica.AAC.4
MSHCAEASASYASRAASLIGGVTGCTRARVWRRARDRRPRRTCAARRRLRARRVAPPSPSSSAIAA